jgi:hypothetical protein
MSKRGDFAYDLAAVKATTESEVASLLNQGDDDRSPSASQANSEAAPAISQHEPIQEAAEQRP